MNTKKLLAILLGIVLTFGLLAGCSEEETQIGDLSSFTAQTLDGGTFSQDDLKAKDATAINIWGTFCSPCLEEMPDLAAYAKTLPDNVQLITICADTIGSNGEILSDVADSAKEILQNAGYEGITLTSGDESFVAFVDSIQAFPTTLFVDSSGKITGSPLEGAPKDLAAVYTTRLNQVLKAGGKAEIHAEN